MFRRKCYAAKIQHLKLQSSSSPTIQEDEPHRCVYTTIWHSNKASGRFICTLTLPCRVDLGCRDAMCASRAWNGMQCVYIHHGHAGTVQFSPDSFIILESNLETEDRGSTKKGKSFPDNLSKLFKYTTRLHMERTLRTWCVLPVPAYRCKMECEL